jgi:hypothetical protein
MNEGTFLAILAIVVLAVIAYFLFTRKTKAAVWVSLHDAPFPKETEHDPLYTSPAALRQAFYELYEVVDPAWWDDNVQVRIDPAYHGAAGSSNDIVRINPAYARPCILAHEVCHSIYSKLGTGRQRRFGALLPGIVACDPLIETAIRDYGSAQSWKDVAAWESHAQIYRFFGRHMPRELYEFYPHLV